MLILLIFLEMKVFSNASDLNKHLLEINPKRTNSIGFVPTMGALHQGHLSLIKQSKATCSITVCSIFVNPTQFNDKKDFDKYPHQLDTDLEFLLGVGCDIVFVPTVDEMYPNGFEEKALNVDLAFLGKTLEAEKRPGHYEGVIQIVKKLLDIVLPDVLFLGQKDYQQCMVIQKLIDNYFPNTKIQICDTIRENDGLAMSSRNMRLSEGERSVAVKLYQTLKSIEQNYTSSNIQELITNNIEQLEKEDLINVEYLVVVNGKTLEPIESYNPTITITTLIAAKVGNIRLIDNLILQA